MELSGDEMDEDRGTDEWTNLTDRGGLWHVNDQTYSVFYAMEEVIRQHLTTAAVSKQKEGARKKLTSSILQNEEVLFQWCILAGDTDEGVATTLLEKIVELYVTIRGFAFANSCLHAWNCIRRHTRSHYKHYV